VGKTVVVLLVEEEREGMNKEAQVRKMLIKTKMMMTATEPSS